MITILEGVDGTGKTTLAKSAAFSDHTYKHCGPPGENPFCEYFDLAKGTPEGENVIFDRFHLGERVYGAVYRNNDRLGPVKQRMLERYLLSREAVLILCAPDYRTVSKHFMERAVAGKEMLTPQQGDLHLKLYQRFKYLIATLEIPYTIVDPFKESPEEIREKADFLRSTRNYGPGIGAYSDGVTLVVGDRCNEGPFNEPFISDTGCSPWLAEQLEDAQIAEDELYWVNSVITTPGPDYGEPTNGAFINDLKPRRIIALGNAAADWCHHALGSDDFCKVPHPQFWKRFRHTQRYPLLDLLRDV